MSGSGSNPQSKLVHPPVKYDAHAGMGATKQCKCKLCGSEWPLELGDDAETCEQWAALVIRKMPKPCPLAATVELRTIGRICLMGVQLKGVLHALESLLDGMTTMADSLAQLQRQ